jgi:hypothetical protein
LEGWEVGEEFLAQLIAKGLTQERLNRFKVSPQKVRTEALGILLLRGEDSLT